MGDECREIYFFFFFVHGMDALKSNYNMCKEMNKVYKGTEIF